MPVGVYVRTEEHRKKLSLAWNYNKHFTENCRKKLRDSHIGIKPHLFTEATRLKMSIVKKGKIPWNKGLTSENDSRIKKLSIDHIKKLSIANTGKIFSDEHKKKIGLASSIRNKGKKVWNDGLTKMTDQRVDINGKKTSIGLKLYFKENGVSEESINKMILANTGRKRTENTKLKLRIARINYIKNTKGLVCPREGKYERLLLDKLQDILGFSIKRQFYINGYFLDGYCQELNLAIEVDEEHHYKNGVLRQKDIEKQENIIKALNCKFLRIKEVDIVFDNNINDEKLKLIIQNY